jgi:3-oxo-5alpha-steroid 4-dehydrogenase
VGVCSNGYFASGISISDCIFSGRRAGKHAALSGTIRPKS